MTPMQPAIPLGKVAIHLARSIYRIAHRNDSACYVHMQSDQMLAPYVVKLTPIWSFCPYAWCEPCLCKVLPRPHIISCKLREGECDDMLAIEYRKNNGGTLLKSRPSLGGMAC